jgi:hypothetical protein
MQMRRSAILMTILTIMLGACSSPPSALDGTTAAHPSASSVVLSALGTPFLLAFKIPVCTATLIVAAPAAGASETVESGAIGRKILADGVASNCGPPYLLTP